MAKLEPEVKEFVHKHARVTAEEVARFGDSTHQTQLAVFAELRMRVHDQTATVEVALAASAIALISLYFVPQAIVPDSAPWLARIIIGLVVGAGSAAVLVPIFIGPYLRTSSQATAAAWLRAYEDEIGRRWMRKGREARRWQRAHSS
jgi:hypothetical protein